MREVHLDRALAEHERGATSRLVGSVCDEREYPLLPASDPRARPDAAGNIEVAAPCDAPELIVASIDTLLGRLSAALHNQTTNYADFQGLS